MQNLKNTLALPLLASTLVLSACGSSSSSSSSNVAPPATSTFSESRTWTVTTNQKNTGGDLDHTRFCYDFMNDVQGTDSQCDSGNNWGLIIDNGRTPAFWSNGGVTNPAADGAAFAFFSWDALSQWQNATTDPDTNTDLSSLYVGDSAKGIFSAEMNNQDSWFAYNLDGRSHQIYPNYNVYLITTDNSKVYDPSTTQTFALQITGYYGGATGTAGGHLSLRWIDVADSTVVSTAEVDASSYDNWVYYDLANKTVVDTPDASNWQIAFKRTDVMLNGGDAGDGNGTVGGFVAAHMAGFYDGNGDPVKASFDAPNSTATLAALQTTGDYSTPSNASKWVTDKNSSVINPAADCVMGARGPLFCNYGLYSYNPAGIDDGTGTLSTPAHGLAPRGVNADYDSTDAEGAALLRSGDGQSYARFYVTDIQYSAKTDGSLDTNGNPVLDNNGSQTWTFHFDVQPAH